MTIHGWGFPPPGRGGFDPRRAFPFRPAAQDLPPGPPPRPGGDSMEIRHILVEKYQPAVDIIAEVQGPSGQGPLLPPQPKGP